MHFLDCCTLLGVALTAVAALRAARRETKTSLQAFENELGVQAPLGFWDPAGLSAEAWLNLLVAFACFSSLLWVTVSTQDGDAREFYRRRVVEIKHGRVAMLACTGHLVRRVMRLFSFCDRHTRFDAECRLLIIKLLWRNLEELGVVLIS